MDDDNKTARIQPRLAPGYMPPPIALEREVSKDPSDQPKKVTFIETNKPKSIEPVFIDTAGSQRSQAKPKTVEPVKYDGSTPVEDWLDTVIFAADSNGWPVDDKLVKRVATYLSGKAYQAYRLLAYDGKIDSDETPDPNVTFRLQEGYAKNIEWKSFVEHMKNFFPRHTSFVDSKVALDNRKQREGEKFSSYAVDKLRLCIDNDEVMSKQTKVLYLMAGALPYVREKLEDKEREILDSNDPVNLCIQLGNKYTRSASEKRDILEEARVLHDGLLATVNRMEETTKRMQETENQRLAAAQTPRMKVTNGYKQQPRNNRQQNTNQQQQRGQIRNGRWIPNNSLRCYYCNKPGHFQRNCYARQRAEGGQNRSTNAMQENWGQQVQYQQNNQQGSTDAPTAPPLQPYQGN